MFSAIGLYDNATSLLNPGRWTVEQIVVKLVNMLIGRDRATDSNAIEVCCKNQYHADA